MLCTQVKSDDFGKKRMNLGPPLEDPAAKTKEAAFSGELMYGHPQKRIPQATSHKNTAPRGLLTLDIKLSGEKAHAVLRSAPPVLGTDWTLISRPSDIQKDS